MNPVTTPETKPQNPSSNFDNLSESQQMSVLKFLELTNTEDIDLALRYLKKASFILDRALGNFFSGQMPEEETKSTPAPNLNNSVPNLHQNRIAENNQGFIDPFYGQNFNSLPNGDQFMTRNNGNTGNNANPPQNELASKYKMLANKKQQDEEDNSTLGGMLSTGAKSVFSAGKNAFSYFTADYVGTQFIKYINKKYSDMKKNIDFLDKFNFEDAMKKARETKKPLCVYCHQDGTLFAAIPQIIFNNKIITDQMRKSFHCMGILVNTEKANFITKYVPSKDIPCLVIFRTNILEEPSLVEIMTLTKESAPREIADKLKAAEQNCKTLEKEELKVKRSVDNNMQIEKQLTQALNNPLLMNPFLFPQNMNQVNDPFFMPFPQAHSPQQRPIDPATQARLEEDRILRQIQQEEYKEVERKIKEQKQKEQNDITRRKKEEEEKIQKQKTGRIRERIKETKLTCRTSGK